MTALADQSEDPVRRARRAFGGLALRTRVSVLAALGVGLAVLLTSVAAYATVRSQLNSQRDETLLERAFILEEVWGYDFPTTANSLEVYVGYVRRKLEADGEDRLLHTVRGIGYVLRETPP